MAGGGTTINSVTFNPLKTIFTVNSSEYESAGTITINCSGTPDSAVYVSSISSSDTSIAEATLDSLSRTVSGNDVITDFKVKPNSAGTVTLTAEAYDYVNLRNVTGTLEITVAAADDDEFLNKRGLTHFWDNIDTLKQDKLTAGDNISITSNTISANTGWVYLGETSLSSAASELTFTLPEQYDNYKVMFYAAMASTASDGGWVDFIMYNGSTAISVTHQVQLVTGTTWGAATNANVTFAINGQTNPYAGVLIKFESYRAGANDWRHYRGEFASNNGTGTSIRTTIVNGRATSSSQPTAFTVKSYSGNFNTGASIRVWASNNEH